MRIQVVSHKYTILRILRNAAGILHQDNVISSKAIKFFPILDFRLVVNLLKFNNNVVRIFPQHHMNTVGFCQNLV